ncbi:MAG TPA: epoxide hydrolase [Terracidiphilus sp.]|nr:epoxide hydrolase [Terracidiphilus sp.]
MKIRPFSPPFYAAAVDDLRDRLRRTRWPDEVPDSGWDYGTDTAFMREICLYWRDAFDWQRQIEQMGAFRHFLFTSEDLEIHFIHEGGKGPAPIPLILTHGWPGSFLEFTKIIPLLTDPASHGADPADSFSVVVPSLPGYGYSGKPGRGVNAFPTAACWAALMRELGYAKFGAQGGDIGSGVTTALGLRLADRLLGIHLNFVPGSYRPYLADGTRLFDVEEAYLRGASKWREEHGAYAHLQRTTPLTAAYGLNDSPAGLAGWILEKFRNWSGSEGNLLRLFTRDELLANITLYWMTETIYSSFRMYFEGSRAPLTFAVNERVNVPTAVAHFPGELLFPPQVWVERGYNVTQWTEMPRGGHFAALEQPELLADDLRCFFRQFR